MRFALVLLMTSVASAQYTTLLPFGSIRIGSNYEFLDTYAFDGTTVYCIVHDVESNSTPYWDQQIVRVDHYRTAPTRTELVSNAQWIALTGINPAEGQRLLPGTRSKVIGDYFQFLDHSTDAVYRVNKQTGQLTVFASKAAIEAVAGGTVNLGEECDFTSDDRMLIYDQNTEHVLAIDPAGNISILVHASVISGFYGYSPVNFIAGGLTADPSGNVYWTLTKTGSTGSAGGGIYKWDAGSGMVSQLLTELDIQVASESFGNKAFNDLYFGPDCKLYLYDREAGSRQILVFDPVDPVGTLKVYLSNAELLAGAMGSYFIGMFQAEGYDLTWCSGGLSRYPLNADIYAKRLAGIPPARADFNFDSFVNQVDLDSFKGCRTAPAVPYDPDNLPEACLQVPDCHGIIPADLDRDGDVDHSDFGMFQRCFRSGATPATPGCAD